MQIRRMQLRKWLIQKEMSPAEFARRIDRSVATVSRAVNSKVVPSRITMERIIRETDGDVTANDFYEEAA
jgi:transcriptional regulator with XRE-family HTH domain